MSLPSPSLLLGTSDSRLGSWYPGQENAFREMIAWFHNSPRFLGASLPTGAGKTVLALLLARFSGVRTCILTATKGLQEQYAGDAIPLGGADVRGQNNFRCTLVPTLTADEGPCHEGMSCSYSRSGQCPYRAQLQRALDSQLVITNYAYYLAQTRFSSGLGEFGLLVADEGNLAFSALENHLTVYLDRMSLESLGLQFPSLPTSDVFARTTRTTRTTGTTGAAGTTGTAKKTHQAVKEALETENPTDTIASPDLWAQWQSWASCAAPTALGHAEGLGQQVKALRESGGPVPGALSRAYRSAKSIHARLASLSTASGDWVIQHTRHGMVFTPRWVSGYGSTLFQSVPKVMLMSAILSPKTADAIGVPNADERVWLEIGSYFPPRNTPIWHIPTCRVNYHTDDFGTTLWQSRIDQIIQRRLDRKGIVFTVSYDRARLLLSRSRYKGIMFAHSTGDVVQVVNQFKRANPPAVLVSPTVTTGWDFPAETTGVRYLVVGKVPYPDTKDLVLQARHEDDKDWSAHLAMDMLVQELGRATRSATDKVECLIIDDSWCWFYPKYREFAPKWFRERVRGSLTCVPDVLI